MRDVLLSGAVLLLAVGVGACGGESGTTPGSDATGDGADSGDVGSSDGEPGGDDTDTGPGDGDTDDGPPPTGTNPFADPGPAALALASMDGCLIDEDCTAGMFCYQQVCAFECRQDEDCASGEVCSGRGRCTLGATGEGAQNTRETPARPDVVSGLSLASTPEPVMTVTRNQDSVEYRVRLEGTPPPGGLLYRIERNDALNAPEELFHVQPDENNEIVITIPSGAANPAGDNAAVSVRIQLPFQNLRVLLQPAQPAMGEYLGEVFINGFGQTGLPIEFRVITSPPEATLSQADEAWLVLRTAREHLFSPVDAFDPDREWVRSPLAWDQFTEAWVATFSYEYRFDENSRMSAYPAGQVQRQMRFELDAPDGGLITGRIADRWRGLFDQRSAQGAPEVGVVRFEGTLEAQWSERLTADDLPDALTLDPATPALLPPPGLPSCDGVPFTLEDETDESCDGIGGPGAFTGAGVADQFACARAMADQALAGDTTASQILAFLDDSVDNPGGMSFAEFMEKCAAGEDGICRPSPDILCSRELLAHSFHRYGSASSAVQSSLSGQAPGIISRFQDVSREAFIGRQLGAFQTDVNTRLQLLRDSDMPAIVTSLVRNRTEQLLNEWQANVLDIHMQTLTGQFDSSGLIVLGAAASGQTAASARRRLLAETVQSWRGAMDALVLATQRWDALLDDEIKRAEKADFVSSTMLDLYLTAGVLYQFNIEAGAGFQNASLAGGFGNLMRGLGRLSLSFEELIFARDAEVVTSTSLNPLEDNDSLLNRLRRDAETGLEQAATAIQSILDQTRAEALSETLLRQDFTNTIRDLRAEMAQLCGIPVGCTAEEARTVEECKSRPDAGLCGFALERGTDEYLPYNHPTFVASEGGRMQLEILSALQGVSISQAELDAHVQRSFLELTELERFGDQVQAWNVRRAERIAAMRSNFAQRDTLRQENLRVLFDSLDQMAQTRQEDIASFQAGMAERHRMRVADANTDFALATSQIALQGTANLLNNSASLAGDISKAIAESMPKAAGTSVDATAPARGAALSVGAKVMFGMRGAAIAMQTASDGISIARERRSAVAAAELGRLEDQSTLGSLVADHELAQLQDAIRESDALTSAEIELLRETLQLILAESEAVEAYERDRDQYLQRRLAYLQRLTDGAELALRVEQASMRVQQRLMEYLQIVQRAELINARLADVEGQLNDVEILIGSPAAVFARANRLAQAESRLDRARSAIMDWLVALEYFAVRPFMDQRLQILLARNTFQLEAIVAEMRRIENSCGGAVNQNTAEFSVRNDFLELTNSIEDVFNESVLTPADRFRRVLQEGVVPVDKRIRYSTDSNIGELMRTEQDILSATFTMNLTDWANLATSCNAKIVALQVQLVGEGLGNARPTVSILYDGTAQLRSCQPGVDELVAAFGPGVSSFGAITTMRTRGRSISPTAGINTFPESENRSLSGLPLSSQYTVLINPNVGENRNINWDRLDDIQLRVTYGYQDLFPQGQCQ